MSKSTPPLELKGRSYPSYVSYKEDRESTVMAEIVDGSDSRQKGCGGTRVKPRSHTQNARPSISSVELISSKHIALSGCCSHC